MLHQQSRGLLYKPARNLYSTCHHSFVLVKVNCAEVKENVEGEDDVREQIHASTEAAGCYSKPYSLRKNHHT